MIEFILQSNGFLFLLVIRSGERFPFNKNKKTKKEMEKTLNSRVNEPKNRKYRGDLVGNSQ